MTSSLAAFPKSNVKQTGPFNRDEIFKFTKLIVIWMALIFTPVWLASWLIGLALPKALILLLTQNSATVPTWAIYTAQILQALVPLVAVLVFIPINAMFMVLCERRALALFTVRKGPNRVGPDGMLQTAADAVKLLFKEDITPRGADVLMFTLAPIIFFAPSIFGAIPLLAAVMNAHPLFLTTRLPTGIFYVLAMSSIPVVALVMGGWASNNKYSLVGGLRSAAQAISYEIPLVLSLITICYLNGTLDVVQIAGLQSTGSAQGMSIFMQAQAVAPEGIWTGGVPADKIPLSPGLFNWNLFGNGVMQFNPLQAFGSTGFFATHSSAYCFFSIMLIACCFLLFGVYMTGACAEINRIPFDLPEAESELVSGYNTEYSGIKFAIFFLAEFTNLFIVATIATIMFLGGGSSPIPGFLDAHCFAAIFGGIGAALNFKDNVIVAWLFGSLLNPVTFSAWLWTVIKVYSIVLLAILVRGTLPRFRIDQLMDFGWKRLIPLALVLFLAVVVLKEFVRPWPIS